MALPLAPPVCAEEYDSPAARADRRRERAVRRTLIRSRWWWGPAIAVLTLMSMWGMLRADQFLSGVLVWPHQGARFVEISDGLPATPPGETTGGSITVVISGLNTKSGTAVASALLPALAQDGGRVFSLVYGSGIADDDLTAKYDALITTVRPRDVTFFGSSMGGDVALNLAAHAHRLRTQAVAAQASAAHSPGGADEDPPSPAGSAADGDLVAGTSTGQLLPAPHAGPGTGTTGAPTAEGDANRTDGTDGASVRDLAADRSGRSATGSAAPVEPSSRATRPVMPELPPRVRAVYLDCTPLGADDVRDRSRTSADVLTGVTEAVGTDGGAATRVAVEVLVQRRQWSSGLLPAVTIRWDDLAFKYDQVMREKIRSPGISTSLVKDQYGVIRRMDADARFAELADGADPTPIVYFRPVHAAADTVVAVERVTRELGRLSARHGIPVRIVGVQDGHHASAQSEPQTYLQALTTPFSGRVITGDPGDVTILATGRR